MREIANRRPLKSRQTGWASALARLLLRTPLTPNVVSVSGIGFAGLGAVCFAFAGEYPWLWLGGALFVQLRLLANLMDGLLAVEGGRKSPTGALYNEFPDRIEDALLLVAAGYGADMPTLGWAAALLARARPTPARWAVRWGLPDFCGSDGQAAPHDATDRRFGYGRLPAVMPWVLGAICAGAALTGVRRLRRQACALRESAQ